MNKNYLSSFKTNNIRYAYNFWDKSNYNLINIFIM